jgi:hypothetical protein
VLLVGDDVAAGLLKLMSECMVNDLYIGSFYKPPGRSDPQYLDKLYSFITRIPTANGAQL